MQSKIDSELGLNGLFVDNLHVLRIIDPAVSHATIDLKDESKYYSGKLDEFRQSIQEVLSLTIKFSEEVDREKLSTIASENTLKASTRRVEMETQEIQSQIQEKNMELEHLKRELQLLSQVEAQQREIIDNICQDQ